jgi:hypothetical protein
MRKFLFATAIALAAAAPVAAQDEAMTPTILEDIAMAERLIALGEARGEPLMILAAIRLRATLGGAEAEIPEGFTTREDAFAAARALAGEDAGLTGLIDDVEADNSRRLPICARNGFCF